MKKVSYLLSFLGAVILCTQIADSIICFTCERETTNWRCLRLTICPDHEQKCLTMAEDAGDNSKVLITKRCAQTCPTEGQNSTTGLKSLFCCERNFCNLLPPK